MYARIAIAIGVGLLFLPSAGFAQGDPADGEPRLPVDVPATVVIDARSCHGEGGGDPMPGSANDPVWRARHPGLAAVYAASCAEPRLVFQRHLRIAPLVTGDGATLTLPRLAPAPRVRSVEITTQRSPVKSSHPE